MQSIGERLEEARKRRGISLREAAEATKIRADFLQSLENNQFEIGVPEMYVRGFIRNYANYLKTSPEKLVADYNALVLGKISQNREKARELFGRIEIGGMGNGETPSAAPEKPVQPPVSTNPAPTARSDNHRLKIGLIAGFAVVALLIIVGLVTLILGDSDGDAAGSASSGAATPSVSTPSSGDNPIPANEGSTIVLIARNDVDVTVTSAEGGEVLYRGTLRRGTRTPLAVFGKIVITTPSGADLSIEAANGKAFNMPSQGFSRASYQP